MLKKRLGPQHCSFELTDRQECFFVIFVFRKCVDDLSLICGVHRKLRWFPESCGRARLPQVVGEDVQWKFVATKCLGLWIPATMCVAQNEDTFCCTNMCLQLPKCLHRKRGHETNLLPPCSGATTATKTHGVPSKHPADPRPCRTFATYPSNFQFQ